MELAIIIIAAAALFFYVVFKVLNDKGDKEPTPIQSQPKVKEETKHKLPKNDYEQKFDSMMEEFKKSIPSNCGQFEASGFHNFELKGIYYQDLSDEDLGDFVGLAVAERDNAHDEFAVMIVKYISKDVYRKVGYAPGGYYSLHAYIEKHGFDSSVGKNVLAYGTIWKEEGRFKGRVNIQFNPNHFHDDTPEEERIYEKPNLKKYRMSITEKAVPGKFFGYAETADLFSFSIYNMNGDLIGTVLNEEYLYNTIKKFDGGKVECWGKIDNVEDEYAYHYVYIPGRCGVKKIANAKKKFEEEG